MLLLSRHRAIALGVSVLLSASLAWSQPAAQPLSAAPVAASYTQRYTIAPAAENMRAFSQLAVGVKFSTFGLGIELATPLSQHFNFRIGGNFFQYTDHLTTDGIHYDAALNYSSAEASIDWFPWGRSFHISPGALVYSGNRITANGMVPGGTTFTVNNTNYLSSPTDPVGGNARIDFAHAAPMLTVGWGNLIPRSTRNFSFPFEMGFAYVGDPKVNLNFQGTVCDANDLGCASANSDPTFQANVAAEKTKIQNDANYARFYPILSLGFAYRF